MSGRHPTGRPNGRPPGTPQSQATRDRIAAAKRGKKPSAATRIRMCEARQRYLARLHSVVQA